MPIKGWPVGNWCWCHPAADKTPAVIYVYFSGIVQCRNLAIPPNLHTFSCHQDPDYACEWRNEDHGPGWEVFVEYLCSSNMTHIGLKDSDGWSYFDAVVNGFCDEHDVLANRWSQCDHVYGGINGSVTLFYNKAALKLISDLNIPNDGETFMEFSLNAELEPIYKFCNVKYGLNQKYLIEP